MRNPFSLYKKQTKQGIVWYARFWDCKAEKYSYKSCYFWIGKYEKKY